MRRGASATEGAHDGSTPLMVSDASCVQSLVSARADPCSVVFDVAARGVRKKMEVLLEANADPAKDLGLLGHTLRFF